ncbi:MAG: HAMP domain-containing sensor histidine kinase [Meiothermus sp.]|uniref:sensor histidine kinase n=1 Tax=Meiothermus sp. TaxID=1955249 RepID=UPI0025E7978B|nr:HAMP domain-containing sensor histidine kinase [Meiothermus sp.]MCS7067906.1 HAMP domain-containing histidine kinase [Meiothermus sp.]MDW8425986.1 HAMP domain-containing sensor histidine kinase [Meiothermus sp.]
MTLRLRLLLWLLLALGLLLVPLGGLTVQQAQRTVQETLERAALSRLGFLLSQGRVRIQDLAQVVQEFGGVGFILSAQGRIAYTDLGDYALPEGLEQALARGQSFRQIQNNWLWVALPGEEGGLGLGTPLEEVAALPQRLLRAYLGIGGVLALLAFAVGAWGLSRSLRPLDTVSRELARRSAENLEPLPAPRLPEARPAVQAMNALMAELKTALHRLRVQEQAARRFAYGASHELRNPLTALKGYLEVLQRRPEEPRAAEGALREAGRMESLLEGLLTLARLEGQGRVPAQPLDLRGFLEPSGVQVEGSGWVEAEPRLLSIVLENLLQNAQKHAGGLEKWVLEPAQDGLWLWACDRGPGFAPEVLPRAFEAFVKHDPSDGVGLGLALVAAVARVLGGTVRAENRPDGGARVGVWLPGARPP